MAGRTWRRSTCCLSGSRASRRLRAARARGVGRWGPRPPRGVARRARSQQRRLGSSRRTLGLARRSPRFIEPKAARKIIFALRAALKDTGRLSTIVGVFGNESVKTVSRIASEVPLDAIQLHGDEQIDFCRELRRLAPQQSVIKVV